MDIITVRSLTKVFGEGELAVRALNGVTVSLPSGEFTAIMGPSGSGKSTFLHLLGGIDTPTSGQILLDSHDLAAMDDNSRTTLRRRKIGLVFQASNLLPALTALENVSLPLVFDNVLAGECQRRAEDALALVELTKRQNQHPNHLSGGEQQRVAIARALVIRPTIILADEPTGNLDSKAGAQIVNLFRKLVDQQRHTVIMVTHDAGIAMMADRIMRFSDGMVVSQEQLSRSA